jgi:hypothetical protein
VGLIYICIDFFKIEEELLLIRLELFFGEINEELLLLNEVFYWFVGEEWSYLKVSFFWFYFNFFYFIYKNKLNS